MKWPNVEYGVRRYVVLHHTGMDAPHFDLMFETASDSGLVTFRLPEWPLTADQPVTKLEDHRREYLTFEGGISGNRGSVERVAQGDLTVTETASGWLLRHAEGSFFALFEPHGRPYEETQPDWWITLPANR